MAADEIILIPLVHVMNDTYFDTKNTDSVSIVRRGVRISQVIQYISLYAMHATFNKR